MNVILERIKEAYRLETDAEVADFLDIKPSTLSMQKNRGRLDLKRIIECCSDLNKNWLLEGKGEKRTLSLDSNERSIPVYTSIEIKDQKPDFKNSPRAGNIYADISSAIDRCADASDLIGYVYSGNGMSPTIQENDIAVINLDEEPSSDEVFLITLSHEASLRHLQKEQDKLIAKAEDDNSDPVEIDLSDPQNCIGKLVWVLRRV